MRYTVVGAAGFVGQRLCAHLQGLGHEVFAPARGQEDWIDAELGQVIYCAGLTADYAARPRDTLEAHVGLLTRVLSTARYEALVYLSSTRLYDGQPLAVATETAPLLLDPHNPRHLYDLSKACGEAACLALGGGRARVARLSCVFQDKHDPDGFLGQLLRTALAQGPGTVPWDTAPDFERDYVHLDDVVAGLVAIAGRGTRLVYNLASGENLRNDQLFDAITQACGTRFVASQPARGLPRAARISVEAMRADLDWVSRPALTCIQSLLEPR